MERYVVPPSYDGVVIDSDEEANGRRQAAPARGSGQQLRGPPSYSASSNRANPANMRAPASAGRNSEPRAHSTKPGNGDVTRSAISQAVQRAEGPMTQAPPKAELGMVRRAASSIQAAQADVQEPSPPTKTRSKHRKSSKAAPKQRKDKRGPDRFKLDEAVVGKMDEAISSSEEEDASADSMSEAEDDPIEQQQDVKQFIEKIRNDFVSDHDPLQEANDKEAKIAGVGILLKCFKSVYIIDSILMGGAASLTGKVKVGQILTAVDGCKFESLPEVREKINGPVGSALTLTLQDPPNAEGKLNPPFEVTMIRTALARSDGQQAAASKDQSRSRDGAASYHFQFHLWELSTRMQRHLTEPAASSSANKLLSIFGKASTSKETDVARELGYLGDDMVNWIMKNEFSRTTLDALHHFGRISGDQRAKWNNSQAGMGRKGAEEILYLLSEMGVLRQTTGPDHEPLRDTSTRYCFMYGEDREILNRSQIWLQSARSPVEVTGSLLHMMSALPLSDPMLVNNDGYRKFLSASAEMHKLDLRNCRPEAILACFLNTYHLLLVHALVRTSKFKKVKTLFDSRETFVEFASMHRYQLGSLAVSLRDIQDKLLRGFFWIDPEGQIVLGKGSKSYASVKCFLDKRILLALSLGTKSSVTMRTFTEDNLNGALQETAVECLSALEVHSSSKSVYLPKVFKWFAADLGEDNQLLLKLCAKFVSKELATKIRALADDTDVKLKYMKFSYTLSLRDKMPIRLAPRLEAAVVPYHEEYGSLSASFGSAD